MFVKGLHHHQCCLQRSLQSAVMAIKTKHAPTHIYHQPDALWIQLIWTKLWSACNNNLKFEPHTYHSIKASRHKPLCLDITELWTLRGSIVLYVGCPMGPSSTLCIILIYQKSVFSDARRYLLTDYSYDEPVRLATCPFNTLKQSSMQDSENSPCSLEYDVHSALSGTAFNAFQQ